MSFSTTHQSGRFLLSSWLPALLLSALLAALTSGCVTLDASVPGTLRGDLDGQDVESVGRYEKEISVSHAPCGFGAGPADAFHSDLMSAAALQHADGLANVEFETRADPLDMCLSQLTCGIMMPRHYKLSGTLVRIKRPPPPGKPPMKRALPMAARTTSPDTTEGNRPAGPPVVVMQY